MFLGDRTHLSWALMHLIDISRWCIWCTGGMSFDPKWFPCHYCVPILSHMKVFISQKVSRRWDLALSPITRSQKLWWDKKKTSHHGLWECDETCLIPSVFLIPKLCPLIPKTMGWSQLGRWESVRDIRKISQLCLWDIGGTKWTWDKIFRAYDVGLDSTFPFLWWGFSLKMKGHQNLSHLLFWDMKGHAWENCVLNLSLGTVVGLAKEVSCANMGPDVIVWDKCDPKVCMRDLMGQNVI